MQRFVDASAIGWYHYLYGDNTKANAAIKKDNPDMTDEQIAFSIAKMKEYGLVDSGDTLKLGIGAMTDARMKDFFDQMVKAGVVKAGHRLQEGLYAAIRRQGRRPRPAAEVTERGMARISRRARERVSSATAEPSAASEAAYLARRLGDALAVAARRRQGLRQRRHGARRTSTSTSARASSCRCSARPAAASRRCCACSPA